MQNDKVCKTVHQYSKAPIAEADMEKLLAVAADYSKVKNYVYFRYGGIKSLCKLYPGYTIQNEMTASTLRAELGLPSVYFNLAVFDALGDIKSQWTETKSAIQRAINSNERFTEEDRHYLRFALKVSGCLDGILNQKTLDIPEVMRDRYEVAATGVDKENLNRYLCRQVRKRLATLHTSKAMGFAIAERAYRYGQQGEEQGIFITTKENRRRVFVALTDGNAYKQQLYIKLKPTERRIEIDVPIEVAIRKHPDYVSEIGLSPGVWKMFTTDQGNIYGGEYGDVHKKIADYLDSSGRAYQRERDNNPGRLKYERRKHKLDASLESYVNREINRMLVEEKPRRIFIPRRFGASRAGASAKISYSLKVWKKGFIRDRLEFKCRQHGVEIVEVSAKGISAECSECGGVGDNRGEIFWCRSCGQGLDRKINAARNVLKRGRHAVSDGF